MSTAVSAHTCSALPVPARRRPAVRSVTSCRQPRAGRAVCALSVTKSQAPAKAPVTQRPQPSSASAKAAVLSHLLHFLPFWKEQDHVDSEDQSVSRELLIDTVEKAVEHEESGKSASELRDISAFLAPTGLAEVKFIRRLATMCSQTYLMSKLTERTLHRRLGLRLVTSSTAMLQHPKKRSMREIVEYADAMGVNIHDAEQAQRDALTVEELPAMRALNQSLQTSYGANASKAKHQSPKDAVGASLQAAFNAAAAAAASVTAPFASWGHAAAHTLPVQAMTSQLQGAAAAGQTTAVATMATVGAAVDSAWSKDEALEKAARAKATSPTQWYVADNLADHTRFFVIQGSETLDHWRVNLTFDPVEFEDPSLGVKVHRGVYAAAEALYDRFLPLVREHLLSSPYAKIVFTGHSLGGCLGSLLMLMFVHRKVIPPLNIGPVYTFGAPAVFAEADASVYGHQDTASDGVPLVRNGVMARLGLPAGTIRNVIMHRDIVPRAFACDYSLVSDLLGRVSDSFRNLECLHGSRRKVLYYFLGKMLVLQPDAEHRFVHASEAQHPMLPPGAALYTLRTPGLATTLVRSVSSECLKMGVISQPGLDRVQQAVANIAPAAGLAQSAQPIGAARGPVPKATTLNDAVLDLLNVPHPLDQLSNIASYGPDGAISRFHNPDHYARALAGVLRAQERRQAEQGLQGRLKRTASDLVQNLPEPQVLRGDDAMGLGGEASPGLMFSAPRAYAQAGMLSPAEPVEHGFNLMAPLMGLGSAWHALTAGGAST